MPAIPRTLTGKKLELPVKRILRGEPPEQVASRGSLADPAALDAFVALAQPEMEMEVSPMTAVIARAPTRPRERQSGASVEPAAGVSARRLQLAGRRSWPRPTWRSTSARRTRTPTTFAGASRDSASTI